MVRIAVGYVAIVVICAVLIMVNPMDFMGFARSDDRQASPPAVETSLPAGDVAAIAAAVSESMAGTQPETAPASGGLRISDASIEETAAAIMADLTAAAEADSETRKREAELAEMSATVLEGLQGLRPAPPPASLEALVSAALQEGRSETEIAEIVNAAAAAGQVEVPGMLVTAEGKVDTAVLLATLGDEGALAQGDISEPTALVEGGTQALLAQTEDVTYVVQPGDSLGALALRFYGDAGMYPAIYDRNRQVLATPESIRWGMTLVIPAKSGL